jgi:hypothetical protein
VSNSVVISSRVSPLRDAERILPRSVMIPVNIDPD